MAAVPETGLQAFSRSVGESFSAHRSPTELITDIIGQQIPRIDPAESSHTGQVVYARPEDIRAEQRERAVRMAPHPPARTAERAGQVVGTIGKEIVDPIALAALRIPGARGLLPRVGVNAALGGAYEAGSEALRQEAQEGAISSPGGIGRRAAIGAVAAPVLGEGIRAVGKALGALSRRFGTTAVPRPGGAARVEARPPAFAGALEETATRLASGAKEGFRQVSRVAAKSVSYLDEPAKYSPTLATLREQIEHSDLPGKGTGQLDFNERTLLGTGNFTGRFNAAFEPLKGDKDLVRQSLLLGAYDTRNRGDLWGFRVGKLRTLLDEVRSYANQAGLGLGYVRGYFPRVFDTDALSKGGVGNAFIAKLHQHGIDQADGDIILRNLTDGDGIITSSGAGRSTVSRISPEMSRALGEIPDTELTPFLRTDPEEVIPRYISGVVRRAEYARTFGADNEKLDAAKNQIIKESLQSGRPIRGDEVKRIDDLAEVLAGAYQRIESPALREANNLMTTYQYMRTLPLSVLSSLTEPFIALERGGFKAAAQAIPETLDHLARSIIRTAFKGVPKAQATRDLEDIGLGLDESLAQVLSDQFSGGASTRVQRAFFKGIGLSPWTRLTQVHAMKTAEHMIRDNLAREAAGKATPRMARELRELGLDSARAREWYGAGARRDAPYYPRIQGAILRFVNETIMHPRGTVKPLAMSNPKIRMIMMLKGYHIMAGNTVVKRMLYKLTRGTAVERARVAGAVGSMLSVALLSDRIRNYIKYGEEGNPRQRDEAGMDIFWRALNRSGLTGVLQFANDALNAQRFGSTGLQQLAGPAISQAQELVEGAKAASLGQPSKLQSEVVNAVPLLNITPRTRALVKESVFGPR